MATKKTKVVVSSNGKNIDHAMAAPGKAPVKVKTQAGAKYLLKGEDGFAPENVTLTRVGTDLHITLEGETSPSLILEGYYAHSEPLGLYGVAEDGQLYAYVRTDAGGEIFALPEGQSTPAALGGDSHGPGAAYLTGAEAGNDAFGGFIPLLAMGGLGLLGIAAVAAATGSDGDREIVLPPVPQPEQPPGKPGFDALKAYDDVGPKQGPIHNGDKTDDMRPEFSGTGTPGHTVTIYDNGKVIGQVVVDGGGAWSFTPPKDLGEGKHSITITESDAGGREGEASDPLVFDVDVTPPTKPGWNGTGVDEVIDDVGPVKGNVKPGGVTDDPRPEFKGEGTPGNTITIYDDGKPVGKVPVNDDGTWSFTPPKDLAEGDHSITITESDPVGNESKFTPTTPLADKVYNITATATDSVGQTSNPTGIWNFEVDATAPGKVTDFVVADDVGDKKGPLVNGETTDDDRPTFSGKAEPGATVNIYDGDTLLGSAPVDDKGEWSFTPNKPLSNGPHEFTTEVVDKAGNASGKGDALNVIVDAIPAEVLITALVDDQGDIKGGIAFNGETDDARPEIVGTGKPGSTIKVYDGETLLGEATVKADGSWSVTPSADLAKGLHNITATSTDKAGNTSERTPVFSFSVDTEAPNTPSIDSAKDDVGAKKDLLASGDVTDDPSPTLTGKAEAGSTVTVLDGGKLVGTVVADAEGNWSLTPTTPLSEGEHKFTVTATDKAGNVSPASPEFVLTTDYTPPTLGDNALKDVLDDVNPITGDVKPGGVTDDPRPEFKGEGTPGNTITIYDGEEPIGEVQVKEDGTWAFTPPKDLGEGDHSITVTETDPAGNETEHSAPFEFEVDLTPPDASKLAITGVYDDVGSTGNVASGAATDDSRPLISGTGTAGDTIIVMVKDSLGERELGTAKVNAEGKWELQVETPLVSGPNEFTAIEMDPAGNKTEPSAPYKITVDVVPPSVPVIENVLDDVGVVHMLQKGEVTNDAKPTILGTGQAGNTITVYDGTTTLGTALVKVQGFEKFDLGSGGNALSLSAADLLAGGARDMVTADGKVQMLVNGADGEVNLRGGSDDWTNGGSTTVSGVTYGVYTNLAGTAELLVEDKVHVTIL